LCTRLATEASAVQGASGFRFGLIVEHFFAMGIGIIIGFAYSWQLTMLVLGFLPLILFGGILQVRLSTGFAKRDQQILEDAGKVCEEFVQSFFYLIFLQVAMEAIQNIRTVVQLTKKQYFDDQYSEILDTVYQYYYIFT
jgi:ABC-type bacteriocin/lantibiotic exporter with double-glycine peptidase domain